MLMETLHCGFNNVEDSPSYPAFAPTEYAQTQYAGDNFSSTPTPPKYEDPNNNPYSGYAEYDDVLSELSDLKLTPNSEPKKKKSSRNNSKVNKSVKDDRGRKDSFVYDVRLPPDEQFLFFVPDLDLVKSHLMFAVREEVEVLKEKIIELMEQINSLEYENSVLRQYAPQEALQQLPKKGGSGSQHQS